MRKNAPQLALIPWLAAAAVGLTQLCALADVAVPAAAAQPSPASANSTAAGLAATRNACREQPGAFLKARIRGASSLDINWHGAALQCDGGPRPDGHGMLVSFRASDHAHRLLFIFGIDAAPHAGVAHEVPTNITVIFEGERRLYSTSGDDRCTIDALSAQPLPAQAAMHLLGVRARGFCVAPASAFGSGAPLLVSRFDFSGAIFLDDGDTSNTSPAAPRGNPAATRGHVLDGATPR